MQKPFLNLNQTRIKTAHHKQPCGGCLFMKYGGSVTPALLIINDRFQYSGGRKDQCATLADCHCSTFGQAATSC